MKGELIKREQRLTKFMDILNPEVEDKPVLGKKDLELWQLIQQAYSWRTMFHSPDSVRRMLMELPVERSEKPRSYSSACQIYQDMEYIFGQNVTENRDTQRRILLEYAHNRIAAIQSSGMERIDKEKMIERWYDKIVKLSQLDQKEEGAVGMTPITVNFISGNESVQLITGPNQESNGGSQA
jgi:hypothetical protein